VLDPIASDYRPLLATTATEDFTPIPNYQPKSRFDIANWNQYQEEIDSKIKDQSFIIVVPIYKKICLPQYFFSSAMIFQLIYMKIMNFRFQ
jgi:hypothetical protein